MSHVTPGTVVGGKYRVIREINRGGTAVVYEGHSLVEGSIVALKVLSVKDGKSVVPIKGVKREIQNAASVQHENIVKLIDYVAEDNQIVIVWELVDGLDLLDLLNEKGGRLPERLAAFYFAQLLQGVIFIHAKGLCHRDLKPENCMIERSTNRLKIIDFGLSKHQQSAVTLGVGTPDYMSPELLAGASVQVLNERHVGKYDARAVDVWALGVLLYLLVTGQYPFEDPTQPQNVVATLQNIAAGRMRPLSKRISTECADLITRLLARDPQQRITLQGIAEHSWLTNNGITFKPSSPTVYKASDYAKESPSPAGSPSIPTSLADTVKLVTTTPSPTTEKQQTKGTPATVLVQADSSTTTSFATPAAAAAQVQVKKSSFSFGSFGSGTRAASKTTPTTPKVIGGGGGDINNSFSSLMSSSTSNVKSGSSSGGMSAPMFLSMNSRAATQGGRDKLVPMTSPKDQGKVGAAEVVDVSKKAKLSGICKFLWKGSSS